MAALPENRLLAIARYGMSAKAPALRDLTEPRRTATLVATIRYLEYGVRVQASRPDPNNAGQAPAEPSHARVNEIGSLYLSVAGLLNLMAIIDAAHRAAQTQRAAA